MKRELGGLICQRKWNTFFFFLVGGGGGGGGLGDFFFLFPNQIES